ncbi:hypothetical protein D3C80_637240 [compost metagenome]
MATTSTTITTCSTITPSQRALAPRRLHRALGAINRELDADTRTRHLTAAQGG